MMAKQEPTGTKILLRDKRGKRRWLRRPLDKQLKQDHDTEEMT